MGETKTPELSIIVPVVNEAAELPGLFDALARQQRVSFELLLCDGGSLDGIREVAKRLGDDAPFPCRVLHSERGRGRQMNAGADAAGGGFLLFLHADSHFSDPHALRRGVDALQDRMDLRGDDRVAGRFSLRFSPVAKATSAYQFYEQKARLGRSGCIHGDQGFLLRGSYFREAGPFDISLPYLEDDRFARKVFDSGEWILLPDEIVTSARRFETEGLAERQTLNAMILTFDAIGWDSPLYLFPELYRLKGGSHRLHLLPFLDGIQQLLDTLPLRERLRLWYATGDYVLSNAWQLPFACDYFRRFRGGRGGFRFLQGYDRFARPLLNHALGALAASFLTWIFFQSLRSFLRRSHSSAGAAVQKEQ